ncbi:LPS-assembly lipoprotein LptE [Pseudoxanthomonas wuyuanensis]
MTASRPLARLFAFAATVLLLSGCGFHLRNKISLPDDLGPIRVVSSTRYSPLADMVSTGLQASGAVIADESQEQAATLRIVSERWGDRPISIDQFGRSQEYSLRFAAIFVLTRADGSDLVPQQVVELSRDYVSQPSNVTGTSTEREILADELRREMAESILRRVDGVVRAEAAAPQSPETPEPETP